MIARLRVGGALLLLLLLTLLAAPLQWLANAADLSWRRRVATLWHRSACALIGMRISVRGAPARSRPLLLVSNHQSWADILVLGSAMDLSFIAKSEVRGWPVLGALARLQRTVFVERDARRQSGEQARIIAERLRRGDVMVLFAEGTTSDGNEVLPFKSSLFAAARSALPNPEDEVWIQPVAIAYRGAHGLPLGRFFRPLAAWPGDVALLPHLRAFLREGAFDVELVFGEPIAFGRHGNRKSVAALCHHRVSRLLAASLAARPLEGDAKCACVAPPGGRYRGSSEGPPAESSLEKDR